MSPPTPAPSTAPRVRPTIADVAAEAGVSKATVSRYFIHRERLLSPGDDVAPPLTAAPETALTVARVAALARDEMHG